MSGLWLDALNHPWWSSIGAPLANHLWQSTLIAGFGYLIALLLRLNRARNRHAVWVMASAKFLIPFSLLVAVGTHIESFKETTVKPSAVLRTMQNVGQPFSSRNLSQHVLATTATPVSSLSRVLPVFLLVI